MGITRYPPPILIHQRSKFITDGSQFPSIYSLETTLPCTLIYCSYKWFPLIAGSGWCCVCTLALPRHDWVVMRQGRCRHPGSARLSSLRLSQISPVEARLLTTTSEPGQRKIQRKVWTAHEEANSYIHIFNKSIETWNTNLVARSRWKWFMILLDTWHIQLYAMLLKWCRENALKVNVQYVNSRFKLFLMEKHHRRLL